MKLFDAQGLPKDGRAGPAGANGTSGSNGPTGPAVFLQAEDGEDGWHAIPGRDGKDGAPGAAGAPGATGAAGPTGPAGPAIYLMADDGEEGMMGPPGPATTTTVAANITPDTHPTSRTVWDDEFETGSSIDTAGTRFSGANAWSALNITALTNAVAGGALVLTATLSAPVQQGYMQTVPGGTWEFACKLSPGQFGTTSDVIAGLFLYNSGNGKLYGFEVAYSSGYLFKVTTWNNVTTAVANVATLAMTAYPVPVYLKVIYDGTNLNFCYSFSGVPGTYATLYTVTPATFITAVTNVGLNACCFTSAPSAQAPFDWFRRTA